MYVKNEVELHAARCLENSYVTVNSLFTVDPATYCSDKMKTIFLLFFVFKLISCTPTPIVLWHGMGKLLFIFKINILWLWKFFHFVFRPVISIFS